MDSDVRAQQADLGRGGGGRGRGKDERGGGGGGVEFLRR